MAPIEARSWFFLELERSSARASIFPFSFSAEVVSEANRYRSFFILFNIGISCVNSGKCRRSSCPLILGCHFP